ncbi:MAG: hypothetical protein LAT77_11335 [Aliidiomarina sp.]|uniref:polysaccharide lyase n=1 Tax=Aliidiomarina sp. TaxID=1872439 RepID=UPI0025BBD9A9|nr:hypothetical protein [Aliidiomarina sp.]MCH8502489.1 hypothetical protein [Aliidiomarina sp.]
MRKFILLGVVFPILGITLQIRYSDYDVSELVALPASDVDVFHADAQPSGLPASRLLLEEEFEQPGQPAAARLIAHRYVDFVPEQGVDGSGGIRVSYQGNERGSARVVRNVALAGASEQAELEFAVQFCDGFDFARGGKLHGLGPRQPVAGGNPVEPERWSARLMWRANGTLQTYVYHQDQPGRYGDTKTAPDFQFQPGEYYQVKIRVTLNSAADLADGSMQVFVDDQQLIDHQALRFRSQMSDASQIQQFLFSTFHGGSSPEWAPRDEAGEYKLDCAYFDQVRVTAFD